MHICFLTSEYPKEGESHGGIGAFVKFLAEKLVTKGCIVSVLGIDKSFSNTSFEENGVKIYSLKKSSWKFAKFYDHNIRIQKKLEEINLENPIDIVEGSELNFAFFPKKTYFKKLIRLHGGHHFFAEELGKKPALWRGYQEKKSFKNADAFVAVSDYVGNQTRKYLKHNFNFKTIYNSINSDNFKKEKNLIKKNSLLFIGTVCEKKGIKELVQSIDIVKKQIPDIQLTVVGRDWKFPNGEFYIEYVKKYLTKQTKNCVKFVGAVPQKELPNYINKSAICVFPSHMESFGLTLIEAIFMDKIVIASNIVPFVEIKGKYESFLMMKEITPEEIAKKIIYGLNNFTEVDKALKEGRKDVIKRFDQKNIIEKNINFYNELIKQ